MTGRFPPTRFIRNRNIAMQVDLTWNDTFVKKGFIIKSLTSLWVHNLHNNGEENSKPSLGKEVIEDQTPKSAGWREVQGPNRQGSSYESAGREEPQAGGESKEFYQSR